MQEYKAGVIPILPDLEYSNQSQFFHELHCNHGKRNSIDISKLDSNIEFQHDINLPCDNEDLKTFHCPIPDFEQRYSKQQPRQFICKNLNNSISASVNDELIAPGNFTFAPRQPNTIPEPTLHQKPKLSLLPLNIHTQSLICLTPDSIRLENECRLHFVNHFSSHPPTPDLMFRNSEPAESIFIQAISDKVAVCPATDTRSTRHHGQLRSQFYSDSSPEHSPRNQTPSLLEGSQHRELIRLLPDLTELSAVFAPSSSSHLACNQPARPAHRCPAVAARAPSPESPSPPAESPRASPARPAPGSPSDSGSPCQSGYSSLSAASTASADDGVVRADHQTACVNAPASALPGGGGGAPRGARRDSDARRRGGGWHDSLELGIKSLAALLIVDRGRRPARGNCGRAPDSDDEGGGAGRRRRAGEAG